MPAHRKFDLPKRPRQLVGFILLAAIIIVWGVAITRDARAQSEPLRQGQLRAAFSVWEPFVIDDASGPHGIDMAILTELSHRMSKVLVLQPCPWRRCLKMLEEGDIDVLSSFAYTAEREKFAFYIKPAYSRVSPVFYVRQGKNTQISQYNDLKTLAVGSVVDSRYFEPFDSDTSLNKFEASSEMLLLRMLEASRVDVIVGSDANVDFEIRRNNLGDIIRKADFRPDHHNDIHIAISRNSPLMSQTDQISKVITDLREEGFIARVHARYWPASDDAKYPDNPKPTE
ncbi:transporter substrate-binding domain-containing protein [Thalassospira sp.]|uniref:substrate-binding periplasmic protein n=1 Tax=Thalassospira sp. TaxID=1912094 RepID=UPI00261207E8|nr:transporter substrate-binding domain-containing protein [Thalassospira sp.]MCH2274553.1 transporter substrate-binding domain-containing protein [Thalassospira sp.]